MVPVSVGRWRLGASYHQALKPDAFPLAWAQTYDGITGVTLRQLAFIPLLFK